MLLGHLLEHAVDAQAHVLDLRVPGIQRAGGLRVLKGNDAVDLGWEGVVVQ